MFIFQSLEITLKPVQFQVYLGFRQEIGPDLSGYRQTALNHQFVIAGELPVHPVQFLEDPPVLFGITGLIDIS